ncbi:MAG: tetratricopeptide repeat protein [bacterium]
MRPEPRPVPGLLDVLPVLESQTWADPSPRNVMGLADAYRLVGRPERAIEVLGPLLAEDATAISPRVLLSWCLEEAGRADEAGVALQEVRELDPANPFTAPPEPPSAPPPVASVPAPATVTGPRTDGEAQAEPERALTPEELARIPPGPLYSATLAEIFERQGFEEKAIEIYEQVVRLHPERSDLQERIARLQARVGPEAP